VKAIAWFAAAGFAEDASVTGGVTIPTVTVVEGEIAGLLVLVSATEAVMGLEPIGSEGTVKVATPLTTGAEPNTVDPFEKVIGPVTPEGTCSVIVTGVFGLGFALDTPGAGSTGVVLVIDTIVAGDVAGLLFASPGVEAVIGLEPTGRFETVMVAVPFTTGAVPMGVVPL
jgi:hypothetical protein